MNQTPRFLSKKDFAAYRGVGKSAVSNWAKKGWVVEALDPHDNVLKVDVRMTDAKLNANLDPGRGRPKRSDAEPAGELPLAPRTPSAPRGDTVADVRTELLREQITREKRKNAEEAKLLVRLEDHVRITTELGRLSRERMHSLVRTHSEKLAALKDARGVVAFFGDEIDRVFAELASQARAGELVDLDDEDTAEEAAEVEAALDEPDEETLEVG